MKISVTEFWPKLIQNLQDLIALRAQLYAEGARFISQGRAAHPGNMISAERYAEALYDVSDMATYTKK